MRPQATAPAPCGRSSLLSGRERSGQARAATKALTDEARSLVPPPPLVGPCGIDEHGQLFGRQIGADDAQEPAGQLVVLGRQAAQLEMQSLTLARRAVR